MTDPPARAPRVPGLTGLRVLARGGYATVYRAVQESVGRDVAVKVENRTLESERDQRRFLREARASGRMSSHPHVVDLFDAGVTEDRHPYLIMELCEGSFAERMKASRLSAIEARDVGVKIADALADAHALGVLHRDVKPANILLSRFGEPALADFGLAILAETRDHSITLDVLTPAYAPPETFRYAPPSSPADVYALCATLYALMRGYPPRWRDDRMPSLVSLVDMFNEPIPDLPGVPAGLVGLLRAGMANEQGDRPTAGQLRDALLSLSIDNPGQPGHGGHGMGGPARFGSGVGGPVQADTGPANTGPADTGPAGGAHPPAVEPDPDRTQAYPFLPGGDRVPGARRHPASRLGLGLTALAVVLTLAVLAATRLLPDSGELLPGRFATPAAAARSPAGAPAGSAPGAAASGTAAGRACPIDGLVPGAHCVAAPECYGGLTVTGGTAKADRLSCSGVHTWEVFALADLPGRVASPDYRTVRADADVVRECALSLALVAGLSLDLSWDIDVLPPSPQAFASGDRRVRCLAGRGPDRLSSPAIRP